VAWRVKTNPDLAGGGAGGLRGGGGSNYIQKDNGAARGGSNYIQKDNGAGHGGDVARRGGTAW
jgi:hypothetical protein